MDLLYLYTTTDPSLCGQFHESAMFVLQEGDVLNEEDDPEITLMIAQQLRWNNEPAFYVMPCGEDAYLPSNFQAEHVIMTFDPALMQEYNGSFEPWCTYNIKTNQIVHTNRNPVYAWYHFIERISNEYRSMLESTLKSLVISAQQESFRSTTCMGELLLPMLDEMISQYPYTSIFTDAKEMANTDIEQWYAPNGKGFEAACREFAVALSSM